MVNPPKVVPNTPSPCVTKKSSAILESYRRKKLELEREKTEAKSDSSPAEEKFSLVALRAEQKARRERLLRGLSSERVLSSSVELDPPLHHQIKFVNNEMLGAEVREVVFEKAELRSNRLAREHQKLNRDVCAQAGEIALLKARVNQARRSTAWLTDRGVALADREVALRAKITANISTYNSLKQ